MDKQQRFLILKIWLYNLIISFLIFVKKNSSDKPFTLHGQLFGNSLYLLEDGAIGASGPDCQGVTPQFTPSCTIVQQRNHRPIFFFFFSSKFTPFPLFEISLRESHNAFPRFQNEPSQTLFLAGTHTKRGGVVRVFLPPCIYSSRNLYPVMFETGIYGVEYSCTMSCTRHCAFGSSSHDRRNNWIDLLSLSSVGSNLLMKSVRSIFNLIWYEIIGSSMMREKLY